MLAAIIALGMTSANHEEPTLVSFGWRALTLSAAPLAAAIGVFGVIFGAAASTQMDPTLAIGMSVLIFSGTLQFATLGLLAGGASVAAVVLMAIALNARHLVLGAVLRPRIEGSSLRRALLAWFLIDESFGLAIAAGRRTGFVLAATGCLFFLAWLGGTVLGILGARAVAIEGLAAALFPVLFVGLAAITARGREGALRAAAAAAIALVLGLLIPALHSFVPLAAALAVTLPGRRRG